MAYCVVRTDAMSGTTDATCLEHGRFYNAEGVQSEIQNGSIVQVGALETGERESHKYTDVTANATINDVVLIAAPELIYDTYRHKGVQDFINGAGDIIRGYHLHQWDEFAVTAPGFDPTTLSNAKVGAYVSVAAGKHILSASAAKPQSGLVIGTIEDIEIKNYMTFYTIRVK